MRKLKHKITRKFLISNPYKIYNFVRFALLIVNNYLRNKDKIFQRR